jgi:hypothetical protein
MFVPLIVTAKAEVELKSTNLTVGELTVVADNEVVNLASGADTEPALTFPALISFVEDILAAETEVAAFKVAAETSVAEILVIFALNALRVVALKLAALISPAEEILAAESDVVNLPSGDETDPALTFPPRRFVNAEIFVPLIVRAKAEVALKSTNLAVGELTVVADRDVVNLASGADTDPALTFAALTSLVAEILAAETEVAAFKVAAETSVADILVIFAFTPLKVVALTFPALISFVADKLAEDTEVAALNVAADTSVANTFVRFALSALKVVELTFAALTSPAEDMLAADTEVVNLASGAETDPALTFPALISFVAEMLAAETEVAAFIVAAETSLADTAPATLIDPLAPKTRVVVLAEERLNKPVIVSPLTSTN